MDAFFKAMKAKFQQGGETKKKKSDKEAWKDYVKKNPGKGKTTDVPGAKDFKPNSTPPDSTLRVRDEYRNFPSDSEIRKKISPRKNKGGAKFDEGRKGKK